MSATGPNPTNPFANVSLIPGGVPNANPFANVNLCPATLPGAVTSSAAVPAPAAVAPPATLPAPAAAAGPTGFLRQGGAAGPKRVLVDMDGTIADFDSRALELLQERHGVALNARRCFPLATSFVDPKVKQQLRPRERPNRLLVPRFRMDLRLCLINSATSPEKPTSS